MRKGIHHERCFPFCS